MSYRNRIYDETGLVEICERDRVNIRRGRFKGRTGVVTYIRRINSHPRIYVRIDNAKIPEPVGTWLAPRSMNVIVPEPEDMVK